MSTRATYKFLETTYNPQITYYIHHDGYPQGASAYFYNMILCKNKKGGFSNQFLRANDNAETTFSHSSHTDTDYRYTLNEENLIAKRHNYTSNTFETFFKGNVFDFCNENLSKEKEYKPFKKVKFNYQPEVYHNSETIKEKIDHCLDHLLIWFKNNNTYSGIYDLMLSYLNKYLDAFPELKNEYRKEDIKKVTNV